MKDAISYQSLPSTEGLSSSSDDDAARSLSASQSSSSQCHELKRHLSLFDLVCIGVGSTVGSGVFVLTGLIANRHAGPATFLSWSLAGGAACASGLCYAEMGGRHPSSGSTYVYARETLGETASVVAAACLTLEYLFSASAVARSWGDKVVDYVQDEFGWIDTGYDGSDDGSDVWLLLDPGWGINPMAFLVSLGSVVLLLGGVQESKMVTNVFTTVKMVLVLFMAVAGLSLMRWKENMVPLVPPQFGAAGVLRGATSSFFGYVGFDEICCIAGEAKDPARNMPRAIILSLIMVTVLYIATSLALVGMVPYEDVSTDNGFPDGFRYRGCNWAAEISAIGEIITLPLVVLVTVMVQPRLQYAMAKDGLLPKKFANVDASGNLVYGTKCAGVLMITVATLVPFEYLDDLISAGTLVAFSITDVSVIISHKRSPIESPRLLKQLLAAFMVNSFVFGVSLRWCLGSFVDDGATDGGGATERWSRYLVLASLACACGIGNQIRNCPERKTAYSDEARDGNLFLTPFVPTLPLLGSFINVYLIAQLETSGLIMLFLYIGLMVGLVHFFAPANTTTLKSVSSSPVGAGSGITADTSSLGCNNDEMSDVSFNANPLSYSSISPS